MHRTLRRNALGVALGLTLVSGTSFAQSAAGSLFGKTEAGAAVTIQNTDTGTSRQITAGSDGRFAASQLPTGHYRVISGGVTRNVIVDVGTGTQVNFQAGSAETTLGRIEVVGSRISPIDVSSTESTSVMTAAQIQKLPVSRNATDVALLAPGTVKGDTGFGNLASFGGASVAENGYYINGFDVTNIRTFLSYASLPFEAVAQQQTKTGGYGAEYGRSLGGVINIVTKRGGNDWKFGGSAYWTPESLKEPGRDVLWANPTPSDPKFYAYRSANTSSSLAYNVFASGPVIRDHLFFFALLSGQKDTSDTYGYQTSRHTSDTTPNGMVKLDWNINDSNLLEFTAIDNKDTTHYRDYSYANGETFGRTHGDLDATYDVDSGGRVYIGKYTGYLTDNLTLSLESGRLTNGNANRNPLNLSGADCVRAFDSTKSSAATYTGCWNPSQAVIYDPTFGPEKDIRDSRRLDVEWRLGEHTLRFGYDGEKFESGHAGTTYTGGEYWRHFKVRTAAGTRVNGTLLPFGTNYARRWISKTASGSYEVDNTALYLEDSWQVTTNFLVYAGLRNETFDNKNGSGATFVKASNNIAPRLGFSWDMNGDGTAKLFGSAGRYYIPVSSNTNIRGSGAELFTEEFFRSTGFDPNTGLPTGLGAQIGPKNVTSDGSVPDPRTLAATNLQPMFQDEFILGYQKQLNHTWAAGLKGVYRTVGNGMDDWCSLKAYQDYARDNGFTNFDINSVASCFLLNPGKDTGMALDLNGDGNLVEVTVPAKYFGLPKYKREYRAIELSAEGRGDNWALQGSYTWSKSYGNVEGYVNSSLEQADAGATQDFDNQHFEDGANGYLPNDRRHTLKLFGSYDVSDQWSFGGNLLVQSGRPVNCFGFVPKFGTIDDSKLALYSGSSFYCKLADGSTELRSRGSAGRTPWTWNFNASVTYAPAWADKHLKLGMTVFNLFNNHQVTEYNEFSATGSAAVNLYNPNYLNKANFQTPRSVLFNVRYEF